ncbi:MAG: GyrI-like domain-containing protein [bacterium]|nr:GyrI-like domain-containing protein [bacterium]
MSKPFLFSALFALTFSSFAAADEITVNIEELAPATVAYVRTVGAYGNPEVIGEAYGKVIEWAKGNNVMGDSTQVIGIGWDDPEATPLEECRYDACVTVPAGTSEDGDIGITDIPGGTYAVYTFTGKYDTIGEDIGKAWGDVMGWMATSGYEFDMRPPLEIYKETKEQFEAGEYIVDLCIPVLKK